MSIPDHPLGLQARCYTVISDPLQWLEPRQAATPHLPAARTQVGIDRFSYMPGARVTNDEG